MGDIKNTIVCGDCIEGMNGLPEGSADLVFADPPFNIGYDYDVYNDSREYREYLDWSSRWIAAVHRVLKSDGTFWLAIGDEFAAELKLASQKLGFHCRSWVIWYYTFGVHCSKKFTRSHAHLFHFVKDPKKFTFRDHDVRVPSARELVYNDKRANPAGRMPDDTWMIRPADCVGEFVSDDYENWNPQLDEEAPPDTDRTFVLRPQDVTGGFQPLQDTWYFPRVAGTFKERAGFHGCQMPEQLLGRIIRACSEPGDVVLDPFSGSATTLAVAKKLDRRFIGFDVSKSYVEYGQSRLQSIDIGDPLDGSPEPLKSAPKTARDACGKSKRSGSVESESDPAKSASRKKERLLSLTMLGVVEAFKRTHVGFSADRVVADPELDREFVQACIDLGIEGDARTWNTMLFRLRKAGQLSQIVTTRRTTISWDDCDQYMFASEIALQRLLNDREAQSLDDVLCDPVLAATFDKVAKSLAPGFKSLEYRWAALRLRKEAKKARSRAVELLPPRSFHDRTPLDDISSNDFPDHPGLFLVRVPKSKQRMYVGETLNLRQRLQFIESESQIWRDLTGSSTGLFIETMSIHNSNAGKLAWQSCVVNARKERPLLNYFELRSAS